MGESKTGYTEIVLSFDTLHDRILVDTTIPIDEDFRFIDALEYADGVDGVDGGRYHISLAIGALFELSTVALSVRRVVLAKGEELAKGGRTVSVRWKELKNVFPAGGEYFV